MRRYNWYFGDNNDWTWYHAMLRHYDLSHSGIASWTRVAEKVNALPITKPSAKDIARGDTVAFIFGLSFPSKDDYLKFKLRWL